MGCLRPISWRGSSEIFVLPPEGFIHRRAILDADACAAWTRAVYAARADWIPCFEGVQFTLGRAYYTHLEEDREEEYFAAAPDSDELVNRVLPGMQAGVLAIMAELLGKAVVPRAGWCGPGLHIFPAGAWLSAHGGDIHFDVEGLTVGALGSRAPAVSAIVMLQPPARGGGLRIWNARYAGADEVEGADRLPSTLVEYTEGDLLIMDSYRLHQIQRFEGRRDRVSITAHAVFEGGAWHAWF